MSAAVPDPQETNLSKPTQPDPAQGMPPAAALTQISIGALASQAVYVAAKLGISDLMIDGPKSVDQLASSTNADAPSLYRLLRALSSLGVYAEKENKTFQLTPMSELLRSDLPDSLRDVVIFMGEEWHWNVWAKMLHSVRTGKPAWAEVHGLEVFPYFEANREASKIFDKAMTSFSSLAIKAVLDGYDFSGIGTLVDIAGGHGSLLTSILEANPSMRGVLFDQPHVIDGAREALSDSKTSERVEFTAGDFFVSVPSGGDAYIMKHIIHDWDDERSIAILKCIKEAMNPGGQVLLVEAVIDPANKDFGMLLDIEMLVSPGGKERTAEEYRALFAKAGLRLKQIVKTASPYCVIEAVAE